jgi:tRNA (guanine9-N1)-methyltransferase
METGQLSKKAQKRLAKQQRRQETKSEWRKKIRESKKIKKAALKLQAELEGKPLMASQTPKPVKDQLPKQNQVLIDASFNDQMTDREMVSLASQITRCYSANRRVIRPMTLSVSSFGGKLEEKFYSHHPQFNKFDISFYQEDYLNIPSIPTESLVYLTADCEETIQQLDPTKTYIIGGIVDRNRHKNITANKAKAQGIPCARLPIGEYLKLSSSQVLTCNHGKILNFVYFL